MLQYPERARIIHILTENPHCEENSSAVRQPDKLRVGLPRHHGKPTY